MNQQQKVTARSSKQPIVSARMKRSKKKQTKVPLAPKVFVLLPIIFLSLATTPSAAPTIKIECEWAIDLCK